MREDQYQFFRPLPSNSLIEYLAFFTAFGGLIFAVPRIESLGGPVTLMDFNVALILVFASLTLVLLVWRRLAKIIPSRRAMKRGSSDHADIH